MRTTGLARPRSSGRVPRRGVVVGAVAVAVSLAGCQGHPAGTPAATPPRTSATATPSVSSATLVASPASGSTGLRPGVPITLRASGGVLSSVRATATSLSPKASKAAVPLAGTTTGTSWTAAVPTVPSHEYVLLAVLRAADGTTRTERVTFRTAPPAQVLTMGMAPLDGAQVGIAQPLAVYFDQPVENRAAVERALSVTTSRPVGQAAWHWFSSTEVQYRPRQFWPAGTTVTVTAAMDGVDIGHGVWGTYDRHLKFSVGQDIRVVVDGRADRITVTRNGSTVRTMPTSLGKPGFETWRGVLVTTDRYENIHMDSRTVNIFGPEAYSLGVRYATRVTNSGTFVHAAPWNTHLGIANTSHGCINLSTPDAEWFFTSIPRGTPVTVINSGGDLVRPDNGFAGWNMPWSQWVAGSATTK